MYMTFEKDPKNDNKIGWIIVFILIFLLLFGNWCFGQVYKATDITVILNRKDSISKLELLTAKKFHKILNEHRKSKGLSEVRWSDTLYISTMNHTTWMSYNKTLLMHYETSNTAHFTGENPTDRLNYVLDIKTIGCLENCAWFGWMDGGNIEKMSDEGALTAFNILKDDRPHYEVMINPYAKVHGAYFSYKGGYCVSEFYGTQLVKN